MYSLLDLGQLKRRQRKGSKPRCHWLTHGNIVLLTDGNDPLAGKPLTHAVLPRHRPPPASGAGA